MIPRMVTQMANTSQMKLKTMKINSCLNKVIRTKKMAAIIAHKSDLSDP